MKSVLAKEINDYIDILKCSCVPDSITHCIYAFTNLDTVLFETGVVSKEITEKTLIAWGKTFSCSPITYCSYVSYIRGLCNYLNGIGIRAFIPEMPKRPKTYVPYVFSQKEMDQIFSVADNLHCHHHQKNKYMVLELPMILRLLYGCGLRVSEVVKLQMCNVDLSTGTLEILGAKGKKDRIVPIHESLKEILTAYCVAIGCISNPNNWLFPNADFSSHVNVDAIYHQFSNILIKCEILTKRNEKFRRGPCLHCLRHTFAFEAFRKAEANGRPIEYSVPFLSTYLGHDSLYETENYLKFSPDMYSDSLDMFSIFSSEIFPEVVL